MFADVGQYVFAATHPRIRTSCAPRMFRSKTLIDPEGELDAHELGKFESLGARQGRYRVVVGSHPLPEHNIVLPHQALHHRPHRSTTEGTYDYVAQYKANGETVCQITANNQAYYPPSTQPEQP